MRAEGNGDTLICVQNLLSIVQTECPFARDKGIDARLIDRPSNDMEELDESVTDLLNVYEPRVSDDGLDVIYSDDGNFDVTVNIAASGGGIDGD